MSKVVLSVTPLAPLLMAGTDAKIPELRAASFRGIFRYWLRAVLGDGSNNSAALEELRKEESHYFGSTNDEAGWSSGSPLRLSVVGTASEQEADYDTVLPPRLKFDYIQPMGVKLHFTTHPLRSIENHCDTRFWAMLLLAFNFSGFGKRSRRGGGMMQVEEIELELDRFKDKSEAIRGAELLQTHPTTRDGLVAHLKKVANYIETAQPNRSVPATTATPAYTIFHHDHVQVYLSKRGHSEALTAMVEEFWDQTGSFHHDGGVWGDAKPRRSSAIHIRAHPVGTEWYTLITIFHSVPGASQEWKRMAQVTAKLVPHCDLIYGNLGGW